ncbi:19023_t:CDS:2, partial [Rhizophagus irregularis]
VIIEETITREIETIEKKGEVVGDLIEGEVVEDWTEESLKEFKEVEKRFITEALHWYDDVANSIRAVYTGNLRTTLWKKNKERKN